MCMLGIGLKFWCLDGKHFTNWAVSPAPTWSNLRLTWVTRNPASKQTNKTLKLVRSQSYRVSTWGSEVKSLDGNRENQPCISRLFILMCLLPSTQFLALKVFYFFSCQLSKWCPTYGTCAVYMTLGWMMGLTVTAEPHWPLPRLGWLLPLVFLRADLPWSHCDFGMRCFPRLWCWCLWSPEVWLRVPGTLAVVLFFVRYPGRYHTSACPLKVLRSQELYTRLLEPNNAAVFLGLKPTDLQLPVLLGSWDAVHILFIEEGGRSQILLFFWLPQI